MRQSEKSPRLYLNNNIVVKRKDFVYNTIECCQILSMDTIIKVPPQILYSEPDRLRIH